MLSIALRRCVVALVAIPALAGAEAAPGKTTPGTLTNLLNQAGAAALGASCAAPENAREPACERLRALCAVAEYRATEACGEKGLGRKDQKIVEPGEPTPIPNPRALPSEVDDALAACRRDGQCLTLRDFRAVYRKPYDALGEWCLTWELPEDLGGLDARGRRTAKVVCGAIRDAGADDPAQLQQVRMATVYLLQAAADVTTLNCSTFNLTVPFVRIRHPAKGQTDVSGLFAAGLGGGYYWAKSCHEDWSWGFDAFAFSEGLEVTKKTAQLGVGAGVGVVAYRYFKFAVGVGYDLFRQEADSTGATVTNGLFALERFGRPSLSFLVTLSVQATAPEKKTEPKPEE